MTIRLIVALATSLGWPLDQADVDTTFLWADIKEDIYMQQPKYPDYVCKLLKSLYGLKQAAHLWNQLLSKTLKTFGFRQLMTDTSCFVITDQDGAAVIMTVFVDDLLIAARTAALVQRTIELLKSHFLIKELGPTKWILGIANIRDMDARTIIMHQAKYIMDMVNRYGQQDSASVGLPYSGGDEKQPTEVVDCDPRQASEHRSLTGSLLYVAVATRPDINETVTRLCRSMQSPKTIDMKKAIRCLRYLKGTADMGLQFSGNS